jgi:hypothetical protein
VIPRLKSRLWVEALLRRCQGEGKFGAVIHSGADEAGAVYVAINHLNDTYDLLGPPAGSSHDKEGTRMFRKAIAKPASWDEVRDFITRERKFDFDIWVVEIEDREGLANLVVAPD